MQDLSVIPRGYQKGNWVIFGFVYWTAIILEAPLLFFRCHQLIGKRRLVEISNLRSQGKKIAMVFDHYSMMDIPVPLAIYWWKGHRDLAKNIFYLIGIRWATRLLCKGADRAWVVPPTELPDGDDFETLKPVAKFNIEAKKAARMALRNGKMLWLAPQGTRSRKGFLELAPEGARRFWQDADFVVPVALEGTGVMVPIGLKWYQVWHLRPFTKVKVIIGKPIPIRQVKSVHTVVLEQARLHYLKGNPLMAGDYLDPLLSEYKEKERVAAL